MKKQLIIGVLLILAFTSVQLLAQPRHSGEGPRHKQLMRDLNLTDQQEEQISKLRSDHQMKMIDARAEIQKLEVQLSEEKQKSKLDEAKILSLTKQIGEKRAGLQTQSTEMWLKIYSLLDDKQKELWKEHQPDKMTRRERMKEKIQERITPRHDLN